MISTFRQWALRLGSYALSGIYRLYRTHPAVWRFMARHYRPRMARFARLNAWMTCQFAALDVPAYADFLRRRDWEFRWFDLGSYPPTDKDGYVRAYPEHERCRNGRLEIAGSVVDESSGSSGQPFNWVRSRAELRAVHRNLAAYATMIFPAQRRFVINAYSMGAWATGTNTGIAMSRIAMVKNTGPDIRKIIDTLRHFGPDFEYVVTAYPPFLKRLLDELDAERFPWDAYRISGLVGGEGMTEALRDYLERRFRKVRSGYGASDLTIGMAGETELSVWVRRRLRTDAELRTRLLGPDEQRLPMVFQYNPLETYLETTDGNEILCTINSTAVVNPKVRYNIGDEGRLATLPEVLAAIGDPGVRAEAEAAMRVDGMRLPLLFLFGRKDSTISYMGANIYPQDIEYGLYDGNPYAHLIEGFCLELVEDERLESRPTIHLQLRSPVRLDAAQQALLTDSCQAGVLAHLTRASRDFAESLAEDPSAADVRVVVHDHGTGPFAGAGPKLKNVYLIKGQPA
ncbi:phenylacetate--CoA ligase family protein [Paractinoplanes brasiliensis]|uniref:Phenylacetate-CoA ligase n=1 Tax=Paractinoplanes brasiliensis TaxID=52695 RepID=A0A4R6JBJ6_9ACTN|nr:phenylacetate--CoA ligase family protein [Actinoplanes brasiliensis]TDO33133.1 phenylacetate-CoA ligase [Actinoplanes brasiliensis]GID28850.1 phenylacetate--CoA ligase [Actinoplanes brasiliensis]